MSLVIETKQKIKSTGATFTPKGLADFLSNRILSYFESEDCTVLDPSCGDGELLNSIGEKLSDQGKTFSLFGFDTNRGYLDIAKERLQNFEQNNENFVWGNFLDLTSLPDSNDLSDQESVDIVIANPPYVRTQILGAEEAQKLAKKFNLKGRLDLYYPFLISMTARLRVGGLIGVITSNRYLSTKSGEGIRTFLTENYDVLEVIDLGDTKLFDAAVLPAIFIGRKKNKNLALSGVAKFTKVYEELNGYNGEFEFKEDIYDALNEDTCDYFSLGNKRYKKTIGTLNCILSKRTASWEMLNTNETLWANRINQNSSYTIKDFFKVRVGIKTTADSVFISDKWDNLGDDKPEDTLLKNLVSQENIDRWGMTQNYDLKILYPHISIAGKKKNVDITKFPKAKKYFESHSERLKGRSYVIEAGREWFEIWVAHHPDLWDKPKLIFPDISNTPKFFFDPGGMLVNGNCYWIVSSNPNDVNVLLLIQGVANSKLMTKYHDLMFNNKLYSNRRRYFTQFVERYPLPNPSSVEAEEIISIVRDLNNEVDINAINILENRLEISVARAFNVEPIFDLG